MNAKERVYRRLEGKPVDKIPNLNIFMAVAAKEAHATYSQYAQDYRLLVEGNLRCAEKFGVDAVCVISDPVREASAFGAEVVFPDNNVPYCKAELIQDLGDTSLLQTPSPYDNPRTLDRIKAVEVLHNKVGSDYPVIGWVEGILAEMADLRGVNNLMMDLAMDDERIFAFMDIIYSQQCLFALAQIDAGADIIGVGNAVASLIGPDLYKKYALPYDKKLVDFIHKKNAKVKLHICGNINPLLQQLTTVGADILDIDWMVDFKQAIQIFKNTNTCINGNIDPVAVMMQGNTAAVQDKVEYCAGAADEKTFISAGCEIPPGTPEENLLIMDKALYRT